jgi:hypothetical protein
MRVGIRKFRRNIKFYLQHLPIELTKHRRVVARIVPPMTKIAKSTYKQTKPAKIESKKSKTEKKVEKSPKIEKIDKKDNLKICKHGFLLGLCKYGCK